MSTQIGDRAFAAIGVGPAGDVYHQEGMTLRDYFAGQALPQIASGWPNDEHKILLAKRCYEIADAMLAAREAKP